MKRLFTVLLLASTTALTLAPRPVWADAASTAQAELLLSTLDLKDTLERLLEPLIDEQIQKYPQIAPYKHVMLAFTRKYQSYDSLKPDLVRMYSEAFTAGELAEMIAFYRTPTGRKAAQLSPMLLNQSLELSARRVLENEDELQRMIADEKARIAKAQPSTPSSQ